MTINPFRWLPVLVMMVTIFVFSAQPGDQLQLPEGWNIDKLCHLVEYGVLAATALYALHPVSVPSRNKIALGVVCFASLYGISDEVHQAFVPLRSSTINDVAADALGAALVVWWWWKRGAHAEVKSEKPAQSSRLD